LLKQSPEKNSEGDAHPDLSLPPNALTSKNLVILSGGEAGVKDLT